MLTVKFHVDVEDWTAFNAYAWENVSTLRSRIKRADLLVRLALPAGFILYFVFLSAFGRGSRWPVSIRELLPILPLIAFFAVWWILVPKWHAFRRRRVLRKLVQKADNETFLGQQEATIDSSGIAVVGKNSSAKYNWSSVLSLNETREHIFIFVGTLSGLVIGKRFLSEPGQIQALKDAVEPNLRR